MVLADGTEAVSKVLIVQKQETGKSVIEMRHWVLGLRDMTADAVDG